MVLFRCDGRLRVGGRKNQRNVVRPPDRAYPYGYDGQEALYVLFRSLLLIGVLPSRLFPRSAP